MKKLLCLIMALILIAALSGCGENEENKSDKKQDKTSNSQSWMTAAEPEKCPDFIGKTLEQIEKEYGDQSFNFEIKKEVNTIFDDGEVIAQDPNPNTAIKKKDKITLYVAASSEPVIVPDVSHKTESAAKKALKDAGFYDIEIEQDYSDVVDEGKVIKTKPLAGSKVPPEEKICIYISEGAAVTNY